MDATTYSQLALRTNIDKGFEHGIVHAALGIASEVQEFFEAYNNEDLDGTEAVLELGDLTWFINLMCHHCKIDFNSRVAFGLIEYGSAQSLYFEMNQCAGSICDLVKKNHAYGRPLDIASIEAAIVRMLQITLTLALDLGVSIEQVFDANIAKLAARFPDGTFNIEHCEFRDYHAEEAAAVASMAKC